MCYPSLEEYNQAMQFPQTCLQDPELKQGNVRTNGYDLPLALCGGFALTYTLSCAQKKYAVRCFHKKSSDLEQRYKAVSHKIQQLHSRYFVDFAYQANGIKVNGRTFPIIKMEWFDAPTLGLFLENHYANKTSLTNLKKSLADLAKYLESQNIAHGDIQSGNLLIADNGKTIKLIDYDGFYVDSLKSLNSSELGHKNFQHPRRDATCWNSTLDRFSFILLDVVLDILLTDPNLWNKTNSDSDSFLFTANDFACPGNSKTFKDISANPALQELCQKFMAVCQNNFSAIPNLQTFRQQRSSVLTKFTTNQIRQAYISSYPVLDASNFNLCKPHIGEVVELIGKLVEINDKRKTYKKYLQLNFGHWRNDIININIWKDEVLRLGKQVNAYREGEYISVTGLLEPVYKSPKFGYEHISITMSQTTKIQIITEEEARYRLQAPIHQQSQQKQESLPKNKSLNAELLKNLSSTQKNQNNTISVSRHNSTQNNAQQVSFKNKTIQKSQPNTSKNTNQQLLAQLRQSQNHTVFSAGSHTQNPQLPHQKNPLTTPPPKDNNLGNIIWIIVILFILGFIIFS